MAFFLSPKELSSPPRGNELGQQEDKGEIQDSACLSLASSTEGQTPTGKGPGQVDGPQATFSPPASAYVTILGGVQRPTTTTDRGQVQVPTWPKSEHPHSLNLTYNLFSLSHPVFFLLFLKDFIYLKVKVRDGETER